MTIRQLAAGASFILILTVSRPADAVALARFDFESPANGNQVANLGVGPAGVLLGGATVSNGVLNVDGLGQGLDIPLGALSPFGGDADWRVAFDFASEDAGGGPLFSSDSSNCDFGCNDAAQAGSLNIFLTDAGAVVADAWFIGAIGTDGGLNDGEQHNIELVYTAQDSLWELFLDGDLADDAEWEYRRDATQDRTRVADQSNPDFGFEDIDPGMDGIVATIDNVLIEAPAPPPVLVTVNRDTGAITMESIAEADFAFNSLSISSASGSLASQNWLSIAGNYDAAGDGSVDDDGNWTIVSANGEELSENETAGAGGRLTPGQEVALGDGLWLASPLQDVSVELFDTDANDVVRGAIAYTGAELLFGDLNRDGDLDGVDWDLFVDGFGQDLGGLSGRDAYFLADLNGDQLHNAEDFIEFVEAFDAVNGAGAFAALNVPEPSGLLLLGLAGVGILSLRRRRDDGKSQPQTPRLDGRVVPRAAGLGRLAAILAAAITVSSGSQVSAEVLVEYRFAGDFSDSSGNGRDGIPDRGIFGDGAPGIFDQMLDLTGKPGESLIVPLGDANPFDGSQDFTIDFSFTVDLNFDETGYLLFSSANEDDPTLGDNHSMAIFLDPDGSLVYDNYFVGEIRVDGQDYRDSVSHSVRIAFTAPDELGAPEDPNPGRMFIRVDDEWLVAGEIAPNVPDIGNHSVRLGSSLNEDFPFECEEICAVQDLFGTMDDVIIRDESLAPSQLRAEVDRGTGEISFIGGEFERDIKYYELSSEAGALNPAAWTENNLDAQNVDAVGNGSGETWDALASTANRLVEGFLLGSSLFDANRVISLGPAYSGGAEDIEFEIVTSDNDVLGVEVTYVGEGNVLDCNGDGVLDAQDLACVDSVVALQGMLEELNLLAGDLDTSGTVDFPDFLTLSNNFGQDVGPTGYLQGDIDLNGVVAFPDFLTLSDNFGKSSDAMAAAVPEPSGLAMLVAAGLMGVAGRRRGLVRE